jgi:hypothetical protein
MTNLLTMPLAYKLFVLQLMVGEANYCAEKLALPLPKPLTIHELAKSSVSPPVLRFGGIIDSGLYSFSFGDEKKLWLIYKDDTVYRHFDAWQDLKTAPSLVDTNGAYLLSRKWLEAISIDVAALETKHFPKIWQFEFYDTALTGKPLNRETTPKSKLPIFHTGWGETNNYAVEVVLLGTTKELMELRIKDISFSRRPSFVITNLDVLLDPNNPTNRMVQAAPKHPTMIYSNAQPIDSHSPSANTNREK